MQTDFVHLANSQTISEETDKGRNLNKLAHVRKLLNYQKYRKTLVQPEVSLKLSAMNLVRKEKEIQDAHLCD